VLRALSDAGEGHSPPQGERETLGPWPPIPRFESWQSTPHIALPGDLPRR
jgi:hypothetical protein